MVPETPAPVWRCLVVWSAATSTLTAGALLGVQAALHLWSRPTAGTFDEHLVAGAGVVALLVCPWLWGLTTLGVLDAVRGRITPGAGWWRRATLLACGGAATLAVALPAQAAPPAGPAPPPAGPVHVLDGLPYPDRPVLGEATSSPTTPTATDVPRSRPTRTTHVVRAGDTLWSITETTLRRRDREAPARAEVVEGIALLHAANRAVTGGDPDLILPDQSLTLDPLLDTPKEDHR